MALRIRWDKYETALLLDTCLQIDSGAISRKEAIGDLSKKLRQRAIENGLDIDEIYRNENGISFQIGKVLRLLHHTADAEKQNTKVFIEMVNMYYEDKKRFDAILSEAKGGKRPVKSNQEQFVAWLSEKVSPARLSDYYLVLADIDTYAKKKRITAGAFFETTDSATSLKLLNSINADKIFRFTHKRRMRSIVDVSQLFHKYTKEKETQRTQAQKAALPAVSPIPKPESVRNPFPKSKTQEDAESTQPTTAQDVATPDQVAEIDRGVSQTTDGDVPKQRSFGSKDTPSDTLIVDFEGDNRYAFTKPVSVSYFGEEVFVSSWRKLYIRVCLDLIEDYPAVFSDLRDASVSDDRKYLVYDAETAKRLTTPAEISEGYYVETHRSAFDLIHNIKVLLDLCRVDYENLIIRYINSSGEPAASLAPIESDRGNDSGASGNQEMMEYREEAASSQAKTRLRDPVIASHGMIADKRLESGPKQEKEQADAARLFSAVESREAYSAWLHAEGLPDESIRTLLLAFSKANEHAIRASIISGSLFEVTSTAELDRIWNRLMRDDAFLAYRRQNTVVSFAYYKYRAFRSGNGQSVAVKTQAVGDRAVACNGDSAKQPVSSRPSLAQSRSRIHPGRTEFEEWLCAANIPAGSVKTYADSVESMGSFLLEKGLEDRDIFSIRGLARLERIRANFRNYEAYAQGKTSIDLSLDLYALGKYISFRKNASSGDLDEKEVERFSTILRDNFKNGFRINSMIDRNRFQQYYADLYGTAPEMDGDEILQFLRKIGTLQEDRIYMRDGSSHSDLLDDIQADIAAAFKNGASCVYYSELYRRYQEELASQLQVFRQDVLKQLLVSTSYGAYRAGKQCFSLNGRAPNADDDIRKLMHRSASPLDYEGIHQRLWYIPLDTLKRCLVTTSDMVNVAQETYFYAPNLPVSAEELNQIAELIHGQLGQKSFVTDLEMRALIEKNCPSVAINTESFTTWGLRNCLSVLLRDRFAFVGPIISEKGQALNTSQVFAEFSRSHELLTLDELKDFARDISKGIIYWEAVLDVMVRISQEEFVPKGRIDFDVAAIDEVLDALMEGDYAPLKSFRLFLHYPAIGVRWNAFVLESYVAGYSKRFSLMHANYTATECCGGIVRKASEIKDFQGLITDVLAHSDTWQTSNDALTLLVNQGYLQRKHYTKIDAIIPEAKLLREKYHTGG